MLRIGPAGAPLATPKPGGTLAGVRYCKQIGLPAMEVEFVQGVKMKAELAATIGEEARRMDVSLSVHAPYFINLCTEEPAKMESTRRHLLQSAEMAHLLHASPIVFHPGFYQSKPKGECAARARALLDEILDAMARQGWDDVALGAELTGKKSAYGDVEEIIALAEHFGLERVQPVIDFGHYHARVGRIKGAEDYARVLDLFEKRLGSGFSQSFHCHYSEIEYTDAGEGKHVPIGTLKDYAAAPASGKGSGGPPFKPLVAALVERGYEGTLICESPKMEEDALLIHGEVQRLVGGGRKRAAR